MRTKLMPSGTRNGVDGLSFSASIMKSRNTGAATGPPYPALPPDVPFSVTAITICGFATGANPRKLAL